MMSVRRRSAAARAARALACALVLLLSLSAARAREQPPQTCSAAEAAAAFAAAAEDDRAPTTQPPPPLEQAPPPTPPTPDDDDGQPAILPYFRRAPRLPDHLRLASASLLSPAIAITAAALSDEGGAATGLPLFAALGDSRGRLHLVCPETGMPLSAAAHDSGTDSPVTAVVVAARGSRSAVVCSGHEDGSARCFDFFFLGPPRSSSAVPSAADVEPLMAWSPRIEEAERRELLRRKRRRDGAVAAAAAAAAAASDADDEDDEKNAGPLPAPAAVLHMVHLRGMVGGGVGARSGGGGGKNSSSSSSGGHKVGKGGTAALQQQQRRRWPPGHVAWADAEGRLFLMNARSARPWARFAVPPDVIAAPPSSTARRQAGNNNNNDTASSVASGAAAALPPKQQPPRPRILALRAHQSSRQQGVQLVALSERAAAVAFLKRAGRALARRPCAGLLPPPPPGRAGEEGEDEGGEALSAAVFDVSKPFRAFALSAPPRGSNDDEDQDEDDGEDGSVHLLSMIVPADRRTTGCRVAGRVPLGRALRLSPSPSGGRGRRAAALALLRGARLVASRERLAVFTADGRVVLLNATAVARGETDPRLAVLAAGSVKGLLPPWGGDGGGGDEQQHQQQQRLLRAAGEEEGRWAGLGARFGWRASSDPAPASSSAAPVLAAAPAAAAAAGSTGRAFLSLSSSSSSSSLGMAVGQEGVARAAQPRQQQQQPLLAVWEAVAPSSVVLAGSPPAPGDRRGAPASGWSGGGGSSGYGGGGGGALGAVADMLGTLQPLGLFGMIAYAVWRYQKSQALASDPRLMRGRAALMARRQAGYGGSGGRGLRRGLGGGGVRPMFSDPAGPSLPPGAYALAARGAFGAIREEEEEEEEERYLRGEVGDDDDDRSEDGDPADRAREAAYAAATRVARQAAAASASGGGGLLGPASAADARDPLESPAEAYTRGRAEAALGSGRAMSEGEFSERLARLDAALGHEELARAPRRGGGGAARGAARGGGGGGGGGAWGSGGGAAAPGTFAEEE